MTGDDHALYLGRTFVNLGNLSVTHHALNRILTGVTIATMELYGLGRHFHSGLGSKELSHCGIGTVGQAHVLLPGSTAHEQTGSLNLGLEVGHLELGILELGDSTAKLLALLGILHGLVHSALSNAEGLGSDTDATAVEGLH